VAWALGSRSGSAGLGCWGRDQGIGPGAPPSGITKRDGSYCRTRVHPARHATAHWRW